MTILLVPITREHQDTYIYGVCCKLSWHVLEILGSASHNTYLQGIYI